METVQVLGKGQLVIPARLRRKYDLATGSRLEVRECGGHIELHPLPADPIAAFMGSLPATPSLTAVLQAEHKREVKREEKR